MDGAELARLAAQRAAGGSVRSVEAQSGTGERGGGSGTGERRTISRGERSRISARNRFEGLVTRVIADDVMAQIEIQAGPHRFVSLMTAEAAAELGLKEGVAATAVVKSTNVIVELSAAGR